MKITIKVAHLAALMLFSPRAGCGVRIEPGLRMVATNGTTLAVIRAEPGPGDTLTAPITISLDDCARIIQAAKLRRVTEIELSHANDEFWQAGTGGPVFVPLNLPYPDWRRVIPTRNSGEVTQIDPERLMLFRKAAKILRAPAVPRLVHGGPAGNVLVYLSNEPDFMGVIMRHQHGPQHLPLRSPSEFIAQATQPAPTCASAAPPLPRA